MITAFALFTAHGQDRNPTHENLIGFNFSPDYSFRTLKNNDGSSSSDLVIKSRNDIEIAKFGYTTGLTIFFNVTQKIGLETGIQYSNKGFKTKNQDLIYIPLPPNPSLPTKLKINYAYNYIGFPIKAKFTSGKTKLLFIASAGFTTNFLLNVKQTNYFEYADGKKEKKTESTTSDFNKVDITPMISTGFEYKVSNKIHFIAEPTFRFGLLKTKDTPVSEKLWNFGLNIGFYHGLK